MQINKQTVTCLTLYWEFIAKLFISSDLTYQIYLIINAYKNMKTITKRTTTPDITCFTPSVGVTSTELCLFNFLQNHSSDLRTQLQISSSPLSHAHSSRPLCTQLRISLNLLQNPLRTQLQRSSTHTAGTQPFLTK